jgi:hypothetical protein
MSDFRCINNHEIPPQKFLCPICGLGIHTMDGLTNEEYQAMTGIKTDEDIEEEL